MTFKKRQENTHCILESGTLNLEPLNLEPLNLEPLNLEPLNLEPLNLDITFNANHWNQDFSFKNGHLRSLLNYQDIDDSEVFV